MNEGQRRIAAAVGVATLAGGVVAVVGSTGGASGGLSGLLYGAGGVFGALVTYLAYRDWIPATDVETPDVERAIEQPIPGSEFDRTLAQFDGRGRGILQERSSIHHRLADLAVAVLARRGDYTREDALAAIEAGDWPADSSVAAFLHDPDVTLDRSWRDRLPGITGRDGASDFQRLVRRTVDVLAESADVFDTGARRAPSRIVLDPDADADDRQHTISPIESDEGSPERGGPLLSEDLPTGRWNAVVPVALAFVGFGLVLQRATLLFGGAVAVGFAVYARAFAAPSTPPRVERSIGADEATPGDEIEVTVTVHNEADRTLADLRVIDGVPGGLSVTDGSPRHATALRPGESTTFSYTVTARRGVHEFGPALTVGRDYAGTTARVRRVPAEEASDDAFSCVPSLRGLPVTLPLYTQPGEYLGRIPAGGGEGVEFHSTREYRPGDSTTRIDWNHLARSADDELTTVRFREERAATVALVIDAEPGAYLAPDPDHPGAFERSIDAAGRLLGSLLDAGDRVGVAALGPQPAWLDPGMGVDQERRIERLLATDPAFPPTPPGDEYYPWWAREFHRRFPGETQAVLLSPLCSDRNRFVVNQLRSYGHPVTVISPDPTVEETVGQRLVRLERRIRIEALREAGVHVVDWDMDEDLAIALSRAASRWSQ